MPYEIRKNGQTYEVVNKETGEVKAKHTDEEDAKRQVRLLHAIENDPNWEPKDNG